MRLIVLAILMIATTVNPVAAETISDHQHLPTIEQKGIDYLRSVGLGFSVEIQHSTSLPSKTGGEVCYIVTHVLEELPYLLCLESDGNNIYQSSIRVLQKEDKLIVGIPER